MKMKRILSLLLITLLIALIVVLFIFTESIFEIVIISIPLLLILCCFIYLFVIDCFVGEKEYVYNDAKLIIKRNNRIINIIKQNEVTKMKVYFDCINEDDIYKISFKYKRKYTIYITEKNKKVLENFIIGMKYKKAKNYLYYFLAIFMH